MLQQTRVDAVIPYYQKFLETFPDVRSLARASLEKVLTSWSGLGYYSRARNLHTAAQVIVNEKNGKFPATAEGLRELAGIGDYTASAIASIAFEERVPVLDGNVHRVLTRIYALAGDPKKNPLKPKLALRALELMPSARVGDYNQAMMELGALVCLPADPKCSICPVQKFCRAFQKNEIEKYPTLQKKIIKKVFWEAALIENNGKFLLAKRNNNRHFQAMWEFPRGSVEGLQLKYRKALPAVKHSIMAQNITLTPQLYSFLDGKPVPAEPYVAFRWIQPSELGRFPTSSLNRKILATFLDFRR